MGRVAAAIGLGMAVALSGAAAADKPGKTSQASMQKMLDIVAPAGDRLGPARYGELAAGAVATISFEGDRTHQFTFNAVCDDDCADLNLAALDAAGVELDVDDADDSAPVLEVQADVNGADEDDKPEPRPMTIEVRMISCKAATCAYGLVITRTD